MLICLSIDQDAIACITCNNNITGCINCNSCWIVLSYQLAHVYSRICKQLNAIIKPVRNNNLARCINCDSTWIIELSIGTAR